MKLSELAACDYARIEAVGGSGELRQHFLDMGLIPGCDVSLIKFAPMGDPIEIRIHDYELTLRLADAEHITVEKIEPPVVDDEAKAKAARRALRREIEHPGLGESGIYHDKNDESPLPDDTVLTFALVGNQNCGKTTLFNQLTGSNQRIGNFPGVTVDRKEGAIKGHPETLVIDLPGIYSLSPYSSEEVISRDFVLNEKPKAIINIVDATNIERNLYLTMQLLELGIPMVVALNMMDELTGNGGYIDVNLMEQTLGVPTVPISAAKNEGVDELIDHAIHVAHFQERPSRQDFCDVNDHGGAVHRGLHAVAHLIEDHAENAGIPPKFASSKVIEGDHLIIDQLDLDENEKEMIEHISVQMENERKLDRSAAIADMRFAFIRKLTEACVTKAHHSKEYERSQRLDRILTGKYVAIPAFILIMCAIFFLTFNIIGPWLQDLMATGIDYLTAKLNNAMESAHVNPALQGLVIGGICQGIGVVLSFLPIIVTLFFFLSIIEDSGYTARVAFLTDKLLQKIGLSGRSIVPMLIGFGCTVPAVMATRTLPSMRDRRMTILLLPFMSCSAKLPIYAFFVAAFFPSYGGFIMTGLYVLGILIGILVAILYRHTLFKGEAVPFVMELPNYRLPRPKNVGHLIWDKAKDFLQRAFSIILIATVIIWFLQSFDTHLNFVTNQEDSILAMVASFIAPVFAPAGLGDWRLCVSLISGFMAKESVVSVLYVLYSGVGIASVMTSLQAVSILIFSLLYTPCVAAIASIRRELGNRYALGVVFWQCFIAWLLAVIVFQIGSLIL
ncbi:MAG: ferrous iron transport protein B [Firmicutes bacterium]|nr:ferrous iron transport protein B [Bacillota bacterium]